MSVVDGLGSNPAWGTFFSGTFYSCIVLFTITVPAPQFFFGLSNWEGRWMFKKNNPVSPTFTFTKKGVLFR